MKDGETRLTGVVLILAATLLVSLGQLFFKLSASRLSLSFIGSIGNYFLWIALIIFLGSGVILIFALKNGELSSLYPIIATSYIWVILISMFFFKENIDIWKWIGVVVIISGVILVGIGSKNGG